MVLVALALLMVSIVWLKQMSFTRKTSTWLVRFVQTGGLSSSDEIQVNGIRMGEVKDVSLTDGGVLVELSLDSRVRITRDCVVAIRNVGLMGEKVIAVDLRMSGAPYTARDTIQGVYEKGMPEVVADLAPAVGAVSNLTARLQEVADAMENKGDLKNTLANLRVASEELRGAVAENRRALKGTVDDFQASAKTVRGLTAGREAELRRSLDHFSSAAEKLDRLAGRMDSLRSSLQVVSGKVERGEGTLGKLVHDDHMYEETRTTIAELKALIADVKAHPKKYLTVKIF